MKYGIFLSLIFSLPLLGCQRTPPADPALLDAWIEKIVSPKNRHLRIDVRAFNQELQEKIGKKATEKLQAVTVTNYSAVSALAAPAKRATSYFDVVNFLLDLNADVQEAPNILCTARNARSFGGLATEYVCFTQYALEANKCSTTAIMRVAVNHIKEHLYTDDDEISCMLVQKGLLPRIKELSSFDTADLKQAMAIRHQKTANKICRAPSAQLAQALAELENKIKEKTP